MTVDVRNQVIKTINQYGELQFDSRSLNESLTLEQLKLDSLDVLELIYELEDQFEIVLDAAELSKIGTIGQLISVFEAGLCRAA